MDKLKECKQLKSCYGIIHCDNRGCNCNIERAIAQAYSGLYYNLYNFFLEDNSDNNIKELVYTKSRVENEIYDILRSTLKDMGIFNYG